MEKEDVRSTAHQTIHFELCNALMSRALISNCKCIVGSVVDRTPNPNIMGLEQEYDKSNSINDFRKTCFSWKNWDVTPYPLGDS
jgi:hypothetical protein